MVSSHAATVSAASEASRPSDRAPRLTKPRDRGDAWRVTGVGIRHAPRPSRDRSSRTGCACSSAPCPSSRARTLRCSTSTERPQVATWPGTDLRARRVDRLHALAGRRGRPGQRFRAPDDAARDLDPPDRRGRRPPRTRSARTRCRASRRYWRQSPPASRRPGRRRSPAGRRAARVGPFVDVDAHAGLGFAGPEIAFELAERHEVEPVEPHVAEMPLADMPCEHALAMVAGRRLRELARARDVAAADVEPVASEMPLGDSIHDPPPRETTPEV